MVRRAPNSHSKQNPRTRGESEFDDHRLLSEEQICDGQFLESVFGKRLRAFANSLFEGRIFGGVGPKDLVQHAFADVVKNEEEWKGRTEKTLFARLCAEVRNDFIDLTRKHGVTRYAELAEADTSSRGMNDVRRVLSEVDLASYARFVKQRIPNDKGQHEYIDLWLAGYTVAEAAEMMGVDENKVKKMRVQIRAALRSVITAEMIRGY